LKKNLSQCHFVHQKSHMEWPMPQQLATNHLSHTLPQTIQVKLTAPTRKCCTDPCIVSFATSHRNAQSMQNTQYCSCNKLQLQKYFFHTQQRTSTISSQDNRLVNTGHETFWSYLSTYYIKVWK
jgi:hypothetical protein